MNCSLKIEKQEEGYITLIQSTYNPLPNIQNIVLKHKRFNRDCVIENWILNKYK
jgi:hypothetical protein